MASRFVLGDGKPPEVQPTGMRTTTHHDDEETARQLPAAAVKQDNRGPFTYPRLQ